MIDNTAVPATFAVRWKIERGPGPDGVEMVGLTFENIQMTAVRVILHPKEVALLSAALAIDVAGAAG